MENVKLKMLWFADKYGLPLYKLHRHLKSFDTVEVQGYKKPWIIDNERNQMIAQKLILSKTTKPKLPRLTLEQFCKKYDIQPAQLKARWTCIIKEELNGEILIAETKNNLRHLGILLKSVS
jgi:hypothetical protein